MSPGSPQADPRPSRGAAAALSAARAPAAQERRPLRHSTPAEGLTPLRGLACPLPAPLPPRPHLWEERLPPVAIAPETLASSDVLPSLDCSGSASAGLHLPPRHNRGEATWVLLSPCSAYLQALNVCCYCLEAGQHFVRMCPGPQNPRKHDQPLILIRLTHLRTCMHSCKKYFSHAHYVPSPVLSSLVSTITKKARPCPGRVYGGPGEAGTQALKPQPDERLNGGRTEGCRRMCKGPEAGEQTSAWDPKTAPALGPSSKLL